MGLPKYQKIQNLYDRFLTEDVDAFTRESILWWKNVSIEMFGANEVLYATPGQWIRGLRKRYGEGRVTPIIWPDNRGQMYMFQYTPKLFRAKKLDHWDRLPLVIVLDIYSDGFLGMNLHYLPRKPRAVLLQELGRRISPRIEKGLQGTDITSEIVRSKSKSLENAKTMFREYRIIKHKGRLFRYAKPCFKRYKYNSITSRMFKIPVFEWELAAHLPSDRFFVGESRQTVQQNNINNLRQGK
jgi:hypothetical protein